MEYGSESGGVWNMAMSGVCEYGSESGGVEYGSGVEVCGIWL